MSGDPKFCPECGQRFAEARPYAAHPRATFHCRCGCKWTRWNWIPLHRASQKRQAKRMEKIAHEEFFRGGAE